MYVLMDFTYEMSKSFGTSPFEILNEDAELVVMWLNYFIEKSDVEPQQTKTTEKTKTTKNSQPQRVRVNDKTATGGWF